MLSASLHAGHQYNPRESLIRFFPARFFPHAQHTLTGAGALLDDDDDDDDDEDRPFEAGALFEDTLPGSGARSDPMRDESDPPDAAMQEQRLIAGSSKLEINPPQSGQ